MAGSGDLIDFDVIEGQKENIQALPSGRSARKLAEIYSASPLQKLATPTPSDTRSVNDCIRAEYEAEVDSISESDDPLDVYDRYVRWTLDAYPSAQATPQSQLHTLLERATKAFISSSQYKNDPRYLKIWLHYIHFFSDSPRETFVFLSRHGIGEGLALYYEEYAEWLEGANRWAQAKEVYKLGIEREARPVQRLLRKFKEFEARLEQQSNVDDEPSSPALPTVRPALAAKMDPFGSAARPADPQAQRAGSSGSAKPAKAKMAIFSDADSKPPVLSSREVSSKGWDTIGSMTERKKENVMQAKPWAGETLKAGGKKPGVAKMAVFRDASLSQISNIVVSKNQVTVHPQTGKRERIFVNLSVIYPTPEEAGTELSFEEILAANRGWLDHSWDEEQFVENENSIVSERPPSDENDASVAGKLVIHQDPPDRKSGKLAIHRDAPGTHSEKLMIHHDPPPLVDENGVALPHTKEPRVSKKKKKVMEVNETQIIKAKLDSPSRPKLRKKNTSEPTMTMHTRAATDDIYDIYNAPLKQTSQAEDDSADEDEGDETEGDYTTDAESNGTTRHLTTSEQGDDDDDDDDDNDREGGDEDDEDARSVSEWSDFTARKHIPQLDESGRVDDNDEANASHVSEAAVTTDQESGSQYYDTASIGDNEGFVEEEMSPEHSTRTKTRTVFIPLPPEDYDPPTRPFRDPAEVANNRLPFMTPITERTEVSLEVEVEQRLDQFKTPSKGLAILPDEDEDSDVEQLSSPLQEFLSIEKPKMKAETPPKIASAMKPLSVRKGLSTREAIIQDTTCNPIDDEIRMEILTNVLPHFSSYQGFYDHRTEKYSRGYDIRKYAKALAKNNRGSTDKTMSSLGPVTIELPNTESVYTLRRELGSGAFAPVYLVENSDPAQEGANAGQDENAIMHPRGALHQRRELEALKMEDPPTAWEFYMIRVANSRLGPHHRASASLTYAHEMHLYQDEAFLFMPFHPHGTLLDVVNLFRGEASGVMDEQLAMFFTVELMRTIEALHAKQVIHGDIKPDNCLLRLDSLGGSGASLDGDALRQTHPQPPSSQWRADGSGGWDQRGVTLIDFGRGIDMRAFTKDVQFIADWKTTAQDCAEMREGRPWTWQIDYHGLAGTIHCLLFGKYIETVRSDQGGLTRGGRRYRIRESLKRYWQTDLWGECFDILLNPASCLENEVDQRMPVLKSMRSVREKMERWLEENCERGVGLKALIGKLETYAKARKY